MRHGYSSAAISLAATLLLLTLGTSAPEASAQSYPSRPVRIVIGFAPGGGPDVVARIVAEAMSRRFGQTVVVDNRAGANGILGADIVSKAQPDGHTLLITSASFAINPAVTRKLPFDPIKGFTPVLMLATGGGLFMVINPSLPAKTLQEFVAYAKRPGTKMAYGSAGHGNTTHLAPAMLSVKAGLNMVHVPYKGAPAAAAALFANEVQTVFVTLSSGLPHIKAGRVRVLAYNGKSRSPQLPDVPTLEEAGVPGTVIDGSWYGMFAPPKLAAAVEARLVAEGRSAIVEPTVRDRLATQALEPDGRTGAEFIAFLQGSIQRFTEAARAAGIDPQ
jgi:tripartite-type tricarboxylate transporter receptor subunit TctC